MAKKNLTLDERLEEAIVKDGAYEVPRNWMWTKLKFIGNVKGGKRLPKGKQLLDFKTKYPYIRVADFDSGTIDMSELKYLDEESYNHISNYTISSKDVYVSIAGSIGKVGIIPESLDGANLTENAAKITDITLVSNKYLYYLLLTEKFQRDMQDASIATTQAKLALYKIGDLVIPIPPLKEQQRIVYRIESLFEKLDRAKELIEEARDGFANRRKSILVKAFSGELTKEWRKNNSYYNSVEEIYDKIQEKRDEWFEDRLRFSKENKLPKPKNPKINSKSEKNYELKLKIPYSWRIYRLEDLCYLVTDGTHKTPKYQERGVKFLSVKNVRAFNIKDEDIKFISEDEYREINSRCNPEKNDILYTKVGATFGYAAKNTLEYDFSIFVSLALVKNVKEYFITDYAEYIMNSPLVYEQARNRVSGSGRPDLHLIEIRDFKIPLPSVEEQKEIVRILNKFFEEESKIEELTQLEEQIELIKKSILAKAFRGELGTNLEEDESALELLKEILSKQ